MRRSGWGFGRVGGRPLAHGERLGAFGGSAEALDLGPERAAVRLEDYERKLPREDPVEAFYRKPRLSNPRGG